MARIALFSLLRARAFVARLEVDVGRTSICYACLSLVSSPLDDGDERRAIGEARKPTPILWDEGLREYALAVVRHAAQAGIAEADAAFTDLELNDGRSAVARAPALRPADDLTRRTRTQTRLEAAARDRLRRAPPELTERSADVALLT